MGGRPEVKFGGDGLGACIAGGSWASEGGLSSGGSPAFSGQTGLHC